MKILKTNSWVVLCAVALLLVGQAAWAQTATVPARVTGPVDDTQTVTLQGNVHPLARVGFDQGPVSDAQPATRMLLLLQRSPAQETSLRQLLDQQQDKTSSNYHAWLTPAKFANQFGPADADIQAVTGWLQSHGFQNVKVGVGRTTIEFSGNVGQVRNTFHTDIHSFLVHGEQHVANVSDPQIPAALAPVLSGVVGLHNFRPKSQMHRMKNFLGAKVAGSGPKPAVTFTCTTGPCYGLGPADFAKIYNIPSTLTGAGVTIAIVQDSNINVSDIQQFRTLFGLSSNFGNSNVILNGPDPGIQGPNSLSGDEGEADLDVEWAGAVAQGATIDLVVSEGSDTIGAAGTDLSAIYIIDTNLAPILSESFGVCEAFGGTGYNAFIDALWEQAAAQGITVTVATGDTGSDSCDASSNIPVDYSTSGLGVSGLASTPFNVALGGTDFQNFPNGAISSPYWSTAEPPAESALSYIPESTWNSGCAATATTATLNTSCTATIITQNTNNGSFEDLEGGGGGQSNCATLNSSGTACSAGYPKPSWQSNVTPAADTYRDIPDVSLYAAVNTSNNSFYIMCEQDSPPPGGQNGNACALASGQPVEITGVGGTSAAAPAFAGIMALVIQQQNGARQGNANYVLYQLYKKNTAGTICTSNAASVSATGCIFYDTVTGNNSVACAGSSPNCSNTSSSANEYGVLVDPSNKSNPAFLTTTGYDKATGLGSVNVANLAKAWGSATFDATTTTISAPSPSTITHGATVTFTVNVTSGSGTPSGSVALLASPPGFTPAEIGVLSNSTSSSTLPTFELSGGTATITTNALPGYLNTQGVATPYPVVAQYSGDGTFAPGTSPSVNVTVGKENSLTTISMLTYDSNDGLWDIPAPNPVTYGAMAYIMRVDVTNSANQPCDANEVPCPTGTVTETYDGGKPLNDFPSTQTGTSSNSASLLNSLGFLEDQPINLPGGSHTIVAAYSGDNSYNASSNSSSPFSLTVSAAQTATFVTANTTTPSTTTSVQLTATVETQSGGAGPTGSVTFTASGPGGTTTLGTINSVVSTAASGLNTTTPIAAYATATLNHTFATAGTYTVSAAYTTGDANYSSSSSASTGGNLSLTVTQSTGIGSFTLAGTAATATAGGSGTSTITLTPTGGFTGSVAITCGTALPGVTCGALNVTVPSGGGNGTGTLTVNVAAPSSTTTAMNFPETRTFRAAIFPAAPSGRSGWWTLSGLTGLAAILLLFVPGRKRYRAALGLALMCVLSFTLGCGGGGGGGGGGGTTPTVTHLTVSSTKLAAAPTASITVSATVTGGTPTGNVEFLVDGAILGTAPVANGTTGNITVTGAQAPPFLELVGTHTVSASYLGDATTGASSSGTLNVTVTGTAPLPIAANPASSNVGPTIGLTIN
jgi:hypothetical protein